jgi:D-lactate dehydrogenase
MSVKIAFFDAKPYDRESFDLMNRDFGYTIKYFKMHLSAESVVMTKGFDTVCAFVNDVITSEIIDFLLESHVKAIALRSAGYNNVDLKSAFEKIHVMRVPAYSPHAIAEHTAALML